MPRPTAQPIRRPGGRTSAILASLTVSALLALPPARVAHAGDAYPNKPVKLVVPTGPGGNLDLAARIFGQKFTDLFGQPFVIENVAGASSLLATRQVARSAPDGYTMMAIANTFVMAPSFVLNPGYDPAKDFVLLGMMNQVPLLMVSAGNAPQKSLAEFVAAAKSANPPLSFASGGNGSTTHLGALVFFQAAGLKLLHVPYKGNPPAFPDVQSGRVNVLFDPISTSTGFVRDGRFKTFGLTSAKRSPLLPNVPTVAEQGYPGFEFSIYTALVAPTGLPAEVLARLRGGIARFANDGELRERFAKDGSELIGPMNDAQLNEFLQREVTRYLTVTRAAGVKPE